MAKPSEQDPQPISFEDAKRIWNLQKQKAPLSPEDQKLLAQAAEWQMWKSHGIRLKSGSSAAKTSSPPSVDSRKSEAVC